MNKNTYEMLEYIGEDEISVVGRVITRNDKFCTASIEMDIFEEIGELNQIRAFLDEVEKIMTREANE